MGMDLVDITRPAKVIEMKRARILEVLYSFRFGGSEMVGLELARQLAESGAEVLCSAIDGASGPLREQCTAYALPVVDLEIPSEGVLGRNGYTLNLVRRLKQLDLDAIHLQHLLALNKLGLAARLAGIKRIVVTEHSEAALRDSLAGRLRARMNWRLAHHITVIHQGIKDYLVNQVGVKSSRIAVVPVGIDVRQWHRVDRAQCRAKLAIGPEFVFVFIGRISPEKNVPGLIEAFLVAVHREPMPMRLLIVGDGADMAKCRALVTAHPAGHCVHFAGEQSDIRPYLAAADALIMNSSWEGTPRALLEAMAMGLPGICPAVGGVSELLQGRGWLTEPGNPASLTDAILDAIAHPVKVGAFGELAQAYVSATFDAKDILPRYQRLLTGTKGPGASMTITV
jgi:glycosyltransferase involved in cell wall biosynthesis